MMEDYIRSNLGDKYADFYRDSSPKERDRINIHIMSVLALSENEYSVSMRKEKVIVGDTITMRYILETEVKLNRKK